MREVIQVLRIILLGAAVLGLLTRCAHADSVIQVHRNPAKTLTSKDTLVQKFVFTPGATTAAGTYIVSFTLKSSSAGAQTSTTQTVNVVVNSSHVVTTVGGVAQDFFQQSQAIGGNASDTVADKFLYGYKSFQIAPPSGGAIVPNEVGSYYKSETAYDSAAVGTTFSPVYNIYLPGAVDPCPPRTLEFKLNLTLNPNPTTAWAGGYFLVKLMVDGHIERTSVLDLRGLITMSPMVVAVRETGVKTTNASFTYSWTVNGVPVASGSYNCGDEIVNNIVINGATIATPEGGQGSPGPDGTTGNTTTGTTGGNAGTGTGGGPTGGGGPVTGGPGSGGYTTTTQTSTVNNGASGLTNQSLYNDVYQALIDAGNTGTFVNGVFKDVDTSEDGGWSTLPDKEGELTDAKDGVLSAISAKIESLSLSGLPTSFGTVSEMDFGTYDFGGNDVHLAVSLSSGPIGSKVPIFRTIVLWTITVGFILLYIRTFKGYL